MPKITEHEFLRRLDSLDEETLVFLSRHAEERRKLTSALTWVSALIASITDFALMVGYFFPESSKFIIAVVSTVVAAIVGWLGLWERMRVERQLLEHILKESYQEKLGSHDATRKKELIEKFLKAEGL